MNEFKEIRERLNIITVATDNGLIVNHSDMCCCPFHSERTESMKLYKRDNKFFCFGCGASGDAIDLTSRLYNISLRDAAKKLNDDYSLGIRFSGRDSTNYSKPVPTNKPPVPFNTVQAAPKPPVYKKWKQWEMLRSHEYLSKDKKKTCTKNYISKA